MKKTISLLTYIISISVLLISTSSNATTGDLDISFDADGKVTTAFDDNASIHDIAIQSDGKIIAVGEKWDSIGFSMVMAIARYNNDGSLDTKFTKTFSGGSLRAYAVAIQSDNKFVVAGHYESGMTYEAVLIRFNADTTIDTSFGVNGIVRSTFPGDSRILDLKIQDDGRLVVPIDTSGAMGADLIVARYTSDGILDNSFDSDGIAVVTTSGGYAPALALAIQEDQKIIVASNTFGMSSNLILARFNIDGSLDTSYGTNGIASTVIYGQSLPSAIELQSDNKILVAIDAGSVMDVAMAVARFDQNGNLDTTFDTDGIASIKLQDFSYSYNVAIQQNGKILLTGSMDDVSLSQYQGVIARFNIDGSLDQDFATSGIATSNFGCGSKFTSVALQDDGNIVIGVDTTGCMTYQFELGRFIGDPTDEPTDTSSGGGAFSPLMLLLALIGAYSCRRNNRQRTTVK